MYKIKLFKTIWGAHPNEPLFELLVSRHEVVYLEYEMEIPFPPWDGLQIRDNSRGCHFWSGEILTTTWYSAEKEFRCHLNDEIAHKSGEQEGSFDWLAEKAFEEGWKLMET